MNPYLYLLGTKKSAEVQNKGTGNKADNGVCRGDYHKTMRQS